MLTIKLSITYTVGYGQAEAQTATMHPKQGKELKQGFEDNDLRM